jgi:hypothetical protein
VVISRKRIAWRDDEAYMRPPSYKLNVWSMGNSDKASVKLPIVGYEEGPTLYMDENYIVAISDGNCSGDKTYTAHVVAAETLKVQRRITVKNCEYLMYEHGRLISVDNEDQLK